MAYVPPAKFAEMREYAENYMQHWTFPLDLTFRSMLRAFETGLVREKRKKRIVPKRIYEIDNTRSLIEFPGKAGRIRKVEVPYNKDKIHQWYMYDAKNFKKESYRMWLHNKWGYGTHDGRRTAIINFLLLYGNTMDSNLEILARTGHESLNEIMPYVREFVTVKAMVDDRQLAQIEKLMEHI